MINSLSIDISEQDIGSIYSIVINTVEKELLTAIMEVANFNQSKAARLLGISRGNLRGKLTKHYGTKYNTHSTSFGGV